MTCQLCADYEESGELAERERIIKLLEVADAEIQRDWLIALIKGETEVSAKQNVGRGNT